MYALPSLQEMLGAFLRTLTYKVAVCTPKSKKKKNLLLYYYWHHCPYL